MTIYKTIIFDLDGTLTNPEKGITNSLIYALKQFDKTVTDKKDLYKFIGPPLSYSFKQFCGFSDTQVQDAINHYRYYFAKKGWAENQVLPGATDLLASLKAQHKQLLLASSKPQPFVLQILDHFNLTDYFDQIAGATLDDSRSTKAQVISHVLKKAGINNPEHCVMVGDREHDIQGAHQNHLPAVGLLLGFGSREELEAAGADVIVRDFDELKALLLVQS
ncbi:HAD family hydrolase [Streptococcus dentapri]|uniref:HAD family hydrolase n=1 Tax=Streptococcus dentapri TaxID=573564 RepID=A0ABV8D063_9STRE